MTDQKPNLSKAAPPATLTHQVSNPLATIIGQAYLIQRKVRAGDMDPQFLLDCVAKIEGMAFRVNDLVKDAEITKPQGAADAVPEGRSPRHKRKRSLPETL